MANDLCMDEEDARCLQREQIIAEVVNTARRKALVEATRAAIRPAIEVADVSGRLKAHALAASPVGVHPSELSYTAEQITESLATLVESGMLSISTRGAYVLTDSREPTQDEALKCTDEILDGWPEDARASVRAAITYGDPDPDPDDYDDDEEDDDE